MSASARAPTDAWTHENLHPFALPFPSEAEARASVTFRLQGSCLPSRSRRCFPRTAERVSPTLPRPLTPARLLRVCHVYPTQLLRALPLRNTSPTAAPALTAEVASKAGDGGPRRPGDGGTALGLSAPLDLLGGTLQSSCGGAADGLVPGERLPLPPPDAVAVVAALRASHAASASGWPDSDDAAANVTRDSWLPVHAWLPRATPPLHAHGALGGGASTQAPAASLDAARFPTDCSAGAGGGEQCAPSAPFLPLLPLHVGGSGELQGQGQHQLLVGARSATQGRESSAASTSIATGAQPGASCVSVGGVTGGVLASAVALPVSRDAAAALTGGGAATGARALLANLPPAMRAALQACLPPGWKPGDALPASLPDLNALLRAAAARKATRPPPP